MARCGCRRTARSSVAQASAPGLPQAHPAAAGRGLAGGQEAGAAHPARVRVAGEAVAASGRDDGAAPPARSRRGPSGSTTSGAGTSWPTAPTTAGGCASFRLIDEYSRECLALHVARKLTAHDLVEVMERLVAERGAPAHIRSDNGSEFIARILQQWLAQRR